MMARVQEYRDDGSHIERDEDGYILNPQVGDVDYSLTCMSCENVGRVTLYDIVAWDAGRVEEWYCDDCYGMEMERWNSHESS